VRNGVRHLYVHLPFCASRCGYCDFVTLVGRRASHDVYVEALLAELDEPLMSSTLILPGRDMPETEAPAIRERLEREVDLVIDGGHCGFEPTTVIEMSEGAPRVLRQGCGVVDGLS